MYDAIVVGARCAGSPTAMLLARKGYRVLLLDRTSFPERHALHALHPSAGSRAAAAVGSSRPAARLGLPTRHATALRRRPLRSDRRATGCGRCRRRLRAATHGPRRDPRRGRGRGWSRAARALHGGRAAHRRRTCDRRPRAHAPRDERDRARTDRHRRRRPPLAGRTRGAGTRLRRPARAHVRLLLLLERRAARRRRALPRPGRTITAGPTNDGRTLVISFWPRDRFHEVRADIEHSFLESLELAPGLAERVRSGERSRALPRHRRPPVLLPQALRPRLGPRRRRRLPQGSDHRAGHHGRLPRRRVARARHRRGARRPPAAAGGARRVRAAAQRARATDLRLHASARWARAAARRDAGALRRPSPRRGGHVRFFGTIAGTVPIPEFFAPDNMARILGRPPELKAVA